MRPLSIVLLLLAFFPANAQSFLNGDFENHSAPNCQLNISNSVFSSFMTGCQAFGIGNEIDIQDAACGYGVPTSGDWFLSLANSSLNNSDAVSLELSSPLIAGNSYSFCYYEMSTTMYPNLSPLLIGISQVPNSFGTQIFSSQPSIEEWSRRVVNFTAPVNGGYITIKLAPALVGWIFIDNFSFCCFTGMGNDTTLCTGDELVLAADNPGAVYTWHDNSHEPGFTVTAPGIYWMNMSYGTCSVTDSIEVDYEECGMAIVMPNVITPNADGINDNLVPVKMSNISNPLLFIYNRWGQEIYQTPDLLSGWNGKVNGKVCLSGTYYWMIRYYDQDNKLLAVTGYVTLLE